MICSFTRGLYLEPLVGVATRLYLQLHLCGNPPHFSLLVQSHTHEMVPSPMSQSLMFLSWTDHTCTPSLPGSPIPIYLLINSSTVRVLPIIFKLFFSFVFLLDGHFMIPFYPGAHKHYVAPQSTKMSLESPFFILSCLFFFSLFQSWNIFTSIVIHLSPTVRSCTLLYSVSTQFSGIREYPHTLNPKTKHVLHKTMVVTTFILTSSVTSGILQLMHWSRCLQFFTR